MNNEQPLQSPLSAVEAKKLAEVAHLQELTRQEKMADFQKRLKALFGKPGLLEFLDPNTIITPLLLAVKFSDFPLLRQLLAKGADSSIRDYHGNTALHLAILQGDTPIALYLIASGANINLQNNLGQTPLMLAAKKGDTHVPTILIAKGANQMLQDLEGKTYQDYFRD